IEKSFQTTDVPVATPGQKIAFISSRHIADYEGMKATKIPTNMNRNYRIQKDIPRITIHFDAAFDSRNFKSAADKSVIGAIIRDIQNKKPCFQEIIFKHTHRSGNSHTYRLAKDALDRGETFYLMGEELKHHIFASERR
ncbi:hypothetical protein Golob_013462, partial [Gossypium lobatum]|nr:hypothetical protein [Gossypium lobatum]